MFRLYGQIDGHRITILVDGGSTHNFIQTQVTKFLNLPLLSTFALPVKVGNGSVLHCTHLCPQSPLLQSQSFSINLPMRWLLANPLHPFHTICWFLLWWRPSTTLLSTREAICDRLKRKLSKAQTTMKHFADSKRRDVQHNDGDWVYVKLKPYRQLSVVGAYHKLSKRFYGPFPIMESVDVVPYHLQLPASSEIHPVFHCSLLKPHHRDIPTKIATLPSKARDHHPIIEPLTLLDWKLDHSTSPLDQTGLGPMARFTT